MIKVLPSILTPYILMIQPSSCFYPAPPTFAIHCPAPPSVGVTPSEPLLSVGNTLTLTCTGSDCVGTTTFTFSWLLDGSPVEASLVTDNGTTSQLSVTSVTSADFGMYRCEATSVYGTETAVSYVRERGECPNQLSHCVCELCELAVFHVMSHPCHCVRRSAHSVFLHGGQSCCSAYIISG